MGQETVEFRQFHNPTDKHVLLTKVREDLFSDWLSREADFSVLEGRV